MYVLKILRSKSVCKTHKGCRIHLSVIWALRLSFTLSYTMIYLKLAHWCNLCCPWLEVMRSNPSHLIIVDLSLDEISFCKEVWLPFFKFKLFLYSNYLLLYAEIKHSDWLKEVTWLEPSNNIAFRQCTFCF